MAQLRRWLILVYTLSTFVATLGHDHHRESKTLFAETGCYDQRPHFASHDAPDDSEPLSDCPICEHRNGPQIGQAQVAFVLDAPAVDELAILSWPDAVVVEFRRVGTRGPPQA